LKEDTPVIVQWKEIKQQYSEYILFYRLGDFYELLYEDAKKCSRLLDITLTRKKNKNENVPMAGIPYHSAENYISKLLLSGESIAICEQIGELQSKGLMNREVVRVITPGTLIEEGFLQEQKENILTSISYDEKHKIFGISSVEISSGRFTVQEIKKENLLSEIERINPSELISFIPIFDIVSNILYEHKVKFLKYDGFNFESSKLHLLKHFKIKNLKSFNCENLTIGVTSASLAIKYIQDKHKNSLKCIKKINKLQNDKYLYLDSNTRKNLELNETLSGDYENSLTYILNDSHTAMGARNLKRWINSPLRDINVINNRLDAIEELNNNDNNINNALDNIVDVERILSRISLNCARPRDLLNFKYFLKDVQTIKSSLNTYNSNLLKSIKINITEEAHLIELLERSINENLPLLLKDGEVIKDGYDSELDEYRLIMKSTTKYLLQLESEERISTNIKQLKVCYNKAQGFYIEIPKGKTSHVPKNYIRKQTLKNCERYTIDKLHNLEEKVFSAKTKIIVLEKIIFDELIKKINISYDLLRVTIENICDLDCLVTLSSKIKPLQLNRPHFNKDKILDIRNGKHIVIENINENFTPNDLLLNKNKNFIIITGPNMGGKSTYMRQNALITILAHIGSFVPAEYCNLPEIDKIFTRIGASDNLSKGLSTFMVEMTETANILNNATQNSFVILDEIGRGTSTYDGLSIAWSVINNLATTIKPYTLFSTHYFELTSISKSLTNVDNYSFDAELINGNLKFNHKIKNKTAKKSYGIEVAELAGISNNVLSFARNKLAELEHENKRSLVGNKYLSNIDINNISPRKSLELLYKIKESIK
jgi:DNA mismatch repair protein MutS